jgi:hypothetical protein
VRPSLSEHRYFPLSCPTQSSADNGVPERASPIRPTTEHPIGLLPYGRWRSERFRLGSRQHRATAAIFVQRGTSRRAMWGIWDAPQFGGHAGSICDDGVPVGRRCSSTQRVREMSVGAAEETGEGRPRGPHQDGTAALVVRTDLARHGPASFQISDGKMRL